MQIHRGENLKLNKEKHNFRCMRVPLFRKIIFRYGPELDPQKFDVVMKMPPPNNKRICYHF